MSDPTDHDTRPARAYAVACLRVLPEVCPDAETWRTMIRPYVEGVDATLEPYGGRFLVHGNTATRTVLEGDPSGAAVVIEFPDRERAEAWYSSAAYQEILPVRLRAAEGWAIIVDGVPDTHLATDVLAA